MKLGETISDYFSRTMAIINRMQTHEDKLEDVAVIENILRSFLPKNNFVVYSIEKARDLDAHSLDELENLFMIHVSKFALQEEEQVL